MKKLSRDEMKNVVGGLQEAAIGGCCLHSATWYECGLSKAEAQSGASTGGGLHWCCASCSQVIHP